MCSTHLAAFIARRVYSCFMWLAQPLLLQKLSRRAKSEPVYGQAMQERFGQYAAVGACSTSTYIWVHAVSLGETRAAAVLISHLRQLLPQMRLLLTHGTATGRTQGQLLLQTGDIQVWQPWDTPASVLRFLAHFRPRMGILMETEVWPNWVSGCAEFGIPLCLVNARMSARSLRKAKKMAWLARPAFQGLYGVWAQTQEDALRLSQLGARVRGVMGNLKYDVVPDTKQVEQGQRWRRAHAGPVVLLASSREGEELLLIKKILQLNAKVHRDEAASAAFKSTSAKLQWVVVPRHPQRFDAVFALFAAHGFNVSRRSTWTHAPHPADIWLGDSLGEMALYFSMADVALLGGSFEPLGGQNLIEAAACGCPVVMGPHTFNFAQAAQDAQATGAAFVQPDMACAVEYATALIHSPQRLASARGNALQLGSAHRGAAQRTAQALCALLGD